MVAAAHALLNQRGTPAVFLGEAVMTAAHLLNRSMTRACKARPLRGMAWAYAGGGASVDFLLLGLCQ